MTIAVYYRVSTDQQSIAHQRSAIVEWITSQHYDESQVTTFLDEGVSGAINDGRRPGFTNLIDSIMRGKVRRVLVFETSRLSRNFMDYLRFLELCRAQNCQVEVIGKGPVNFATSEDVLLASVAAFMAQAERERIRARVKSGVRAAQARGVKFGARKGERRRLGIKKQYDPAIVKKIQFLRKKGMTLRDIARVLSEDGTPIGHSTVGAILRRHPICRA